MNRDGDCTSSILGASQFVFSHIAHVRVLTPAVFTCQTLMFVSEPPTPHPHAHTHTHADGCVCEPVYSCLIKSFSLANESPYTLHTDWGVRSSILMNRRSVPANDGTRGNLFVLTGCWSAALWSPFVVLLSHYVSRWRLVSDVFLAALRGVFARPPCGDVTSEELKWWKWVF